MKKIVLFLLSLSFGLIACNMGVAATPIASKQPAPETAPASPIIQPTATRIAPTSTQTTPTATQAAPLAPTSTLEIPSPTQALQAVIVPTSTPLPPPQTLPSNEIKFEIGGTWKDTQDSVPLGGNKTYTLNAMQGQIMSVSIVGGYFPLQIQGRDGTTLCPAESNTECSFWRGALPLSQDYYVTVQSGGSQTNFTLRVAINPPGKAEQTFKYGDPASGVVLAYPDQFAPANLPSTLSNKTNLQLALQLIDTSFYVNTNLSEAYFVLGSSSDPQIVRTCAEANQNGGAPETLNGNVTINGYAFVYSTASGVGAGNIYDQHVYRGVNNGRCYEAIYFIHYSNIGNYPPGVVKEFDLQGLMKKFSAILSTIQLR